MSDRQFVLAEKELTEAIGLWIRARMGGDFVGEYGVRFEINKRAEPGLRVTAVVTPFGPGDVKPHGTVES